MTNPEPGVIRTIEEFVDAVAVDVNYSPLFASKSHIEDLIIELSRQLQASLGSMHQCTTTAEALSYLDAGILSCLAMSNASAGYKVFGREKFRELQARAGERLTEEIATEKREYSCLLARQIIANNQS